MSRERLEPAAISPLERQLRSAAAASSSQAKPQILPVGASPLLSQLKQFLPKMQAANAELHQKLQECDPAELDIEHIPEQQGEEGEEGAGQVIQMDLACGLLELHDDAAVAAAQRAIAAGGDITIESYDGGDSSDSSSSSDDDDDSDVGSDSEGVGASKEGQGVGEVSRDAAAAGSSRSPAAAAAGVVGGDAMEEDKQEQPAAAAGREQQQGKQQRRKLKPKKPMIVELS